MERLQVEPSEAETNTSRNHQVKSQCLYTGVMAVSKSSPVKAISSLIVSIS